MRLPLRAVTTSAVLVCAVAGLTGTTAVATAVAAPAAAAQCGPSFANPMAATPWPLRRLNPPAAWPLSRGKGVTVAVVDSGVSASPPKLAGRVLPGKDYLKLGQPGTCDDDGHGTVVAGLIAASDTSDRGAPYYGVAPDARILPVRVLLNSQPTQDPALPGRIADAIIWATNQGASVINLSLTTPPTQQLADAVSYAQSRDVVLVAAAGNLGGTELGSTGLYPAAYPGVLAVSGIDQSGKLVSTSSSGSDVGVSAPGVYIEGPATHGGGYVVEKSGGTSFACAYVSGVAALVRAYYPDLDAQAVIRRIKFTADPAPYANDQQFGDGTVNPYRALSTVFDSTGAVIHPGAVLRPAPVVDPLAGVKHAAYGIAAGGAALAVALLLANGLLRRGRQRPVGPPAREIRSPDDFTPLIGQQLVVSAPSVNRAGGAGGGMPPGMRG